MSVMKWALLVSLFVSLLVFVCVFDQTPAIASQRAIMVFTGVFLWSYLVFHLMSRLVPPGTGLFVGGGPKAKGKGDAKYIDLEKQSIDREKLEELLR